MSSNYLNTVFNINFNHKGEEISEDFLLHVAPITDYPSTLFDQVVANVLEFTKRYGFTTPKEIRRATCAIYFSISSSPNLTVEQYVTHAKTGATHLLVDDIFDRSELFNPQKVEMVERMTRLLSKYFRCDAAPIDADIREICPKFVSICQMYFELGESLVATGKELTWIYEGFDISVSGNITQLALPHPKSADEYLERKQGNIGMNFYFDVTCFLAGETLSYDVRKSGWFKEFQIVAGAMAALCIDPISFQFDTSEGLKHDNYSVILVQQGFSVKEAIKMSAIRYNQFFIKSIMLISQMDKIHFSEADRRYLRIYFTVISAIFHWASHTYNDAGKSMKFSEIQDEKRAVICVTEALRSISNI